jgi:hypothetical protein
MNSQLDARLLRIGIDVATNSAGRARRKQRHGSGLTVAIIIAALAVAYFGLHMFTKPPSSAIDLPANAGGGASR